MNNYLIPANSKNGQLILNLFKPADLVILAIGTVITVIFLFVFKEDTIPLLVAKLLPVTISLLLVMPIPSYHNVLCAIQSIWNFYNNKRRFVWRGWCFYEKFGREK